jgi:hypothetical protein
MQSIPVLRGAFWMVFTLFGFGALWFLCLMQARPSGGETVAKVD